jgi:hypothetical protein
VGTLPQSPVRRAGGGRRMSTLELGFRKDTLRID